MAVPWYCSGTFTVHPLLGPAAAGAAGVAGADEQQLPRIYQLPPNEHWLRITGASNLTARRSNLPKTVPKFTSVLKVLNFKCTAFDCIIRAAQ